jgi:hypothetical protein
MHPEYCGTTRFKIEARLTGNEPPLEGGTSPWASSGPKKAVHQNPGLRRLTLSFFLRRKGRREKKRMTGRYSSIVSSRLCLACAGQEWVCQTVDRFGAQRKKFDFFGS